MTLLDITDMPKQTFKLCIRSKFAKGEPSKQLHPHKKTTLWNYTT